MRYNTAVAASHRDRGGVSLQNASDYRSVLVFDGNTGRRSVILSYLERIGLAAGVAFSGYEALRLIRESAPGLVICSVSASSDLGGRFFSILAKLQPGIRIILLIDDEAEGPRVRNRCIAGVLRGAFSVEDLHDLLQRALPLVAAQRA